MTRTTPWTLAPASPGTGQWARRAARRALRRASAWLATLARRLGAAEHAASAAAATRDSGAPVFEYHCQAGAPEGALFVDGRLVGTIEGVNRL